MTSIESLENKFQDENITIQNLSNEISQNIINGNLDITGVIESLGFALTSVDVERRVKGTHVLSEILEQLPNDFLNEIQLNFIITFYCDRLKDHHSVIPTVLSGILTIIKMKSLPRDKIAQLLMAMFNNVPCQSQVRGDREKIFDILRIASETKQNELLAMGTDFIYGVINAIDGERDPRILYKIFLFVPDFVRTYPLKHLAEEMFEVCACYFPVDFHPSPNDPLAITRDELAEKLALCLCGTKEFTESCIDLLIDKLTSDLNVAKIDSLNLLFKCTEYFDLEEIEKNFEKIWTGLRGELLPGNKSEITYVALKTLEQLLKCAALKQTDLCDNMLTYVFGYIMIPLSDVNARLFTPSTAIALICCRSSGYACTIITNKCVPLFFMQIEQITGNINDDQKMHSLTQRCTLIDLIHRLLTLSIRNSVIDKIDKKSRDESIDAFCLCLENENDKDLFQIGVRALTKIASIVPADRRNFIYTKIIGMFNNNNNNSEIDSIRSLLIAYAELYPIEIQNNIINKIIHFDDAELASLSVPTNRIRINKIFNSICSLVHIKEFHKIILDVILENIFNGKLNVIQLAALKNLKQLLERNSLITINIQSDKKQNTNDEGGDDDDDDILNIIIELYKNYDIIKRLINYSHLHIPKITKSTGNTGDDDDDDDDVDDDILMEVSIILRYIVKSLDTIEQRKIIKMYLPNMNLQTIDGLYVTSGILGYLDKDVDELKDHFENVVNELMQLSLTHEDEKIVEIANKLLCSLFNKMPNDDVHNNVLKKISEYLKMEIVKHNKRAIQVLSWISKGLLYSGHSDGVELVNTIIELLEHPTLGHTAALAFEIIALEIPGLHLPVIKHLFAQKFFQYILKKILKYSEHHLTAFSYTLRMVPHQVLKMNIQEIGPILFKCITLPTEVQSSSDELKKNNSTSTINNNNNNNNNIEIKNDKHLLTRIQIALEMIERFLMELNEYFRDHLQHFIPSCIQLCKLDSSMKIRITAIKCLGAITKYPAYALMPYKQDVLIGLIESLDDTKRLVRNEAVQTRNLWFIIGSPSK